MGVDGDIGVGHGLATTGGLLGAYEQMVQRHVVLGGGDLQRPGPEIVPSLVQTAKVLQQHTGLPTGRPPLPITDKSDFYQTNQKPELPTCYQKSGQSK